MRALAVRDRTPPSAGPGAPRASNAAQFLAITTKETRDRLTLTVAVGTMLVALSLMTGALWAPMKDQFVRLQDSFPEALLALVPGGDMATPVGWLNAEILSIMAPAALIAVAVISAARSTAGEEETGTLGLLLSAGVGRVLLLCAKAAAMLVHVVITGAMLALGLAAASALGGLGIGAGQILGASVHTMVLAMVFGAVALVMGAGTGRRRTTTAVACGLAGLAFLVASFVPLSDQLAGWEKASPWYYFASSNPLANGPAAGDLGILVIAFAALLAASLALYRRRDLRG